VRVRGDKELVQRLSRVRSRVPALFEDEDAKQLLVRRIKARFMQGVSPEGKPWVNLSPTTIKSKKKKGYAKPEQILFATGRLYNAIKVIRGSNFGKLAISSGLGFRVGVDDEVASQYGMLHNFGYGQIRRRFLGLRETDVVSYTNYLARRLKLMVDTS